EIESVVEMPGSQDIDLMEMSPTIFKSPLFTQTQALVNKEVRSQLPNSVSDDLLRKKKERAQKIYELFTKLGLIRFSVLNQLQLHQFRN
ncbi:35511_t:CDS:2, partial [Racocetra persica]